MAGVKGQRGNRNRTSVRKGQVLNPKGGRKKGSKNKPKDVLDLSEPSITKIRQARGLIALEFEEVFRDMFKIDRAEFEKKMKLALEPGKAAEDKAKKSGRAPKLTKAAASMSMMEVIAYRYFSRLMKGGSADIDTTRMSFIFDIISGKNSPELERSKSLLGRMKDFINDIKIQGLDFDIRYADIVRFMMGSPGITENEMKVLFKVGKELLEIELSRLELIPRANVKVMFKIWSEQMIENFGPFPKLVARFQEGCRTSFKEQLPHGDMVDFPLVKVEQSDSGEIDVTPSTIKETKKSKPKAKSKAKSKAKFKAKKAVKKKTIKKKIVKKKVVKRKTAKSKAKRKTAKKRK